MSEVIKQETQDLLRQAIARLTTEAARADNVPVHAEGLALLLQSRLFVVNWPIAGVESLDFKSMLAGRAVLDNTPVMYWYLSGGGLVEHKGLVEHQTRLHAGFYTVVAHEQRGVVSFRDAKGQTVAEGDLGICIGPQEPPDAIAKVSTSGGIDSASVSLFPPHVKICGHVTVKVDGKSITISACLDAGF